MRYLLIITGLLLLAACKRSDTARTITAEAAAERHVTVVPAAYEQYVVNAGGRGSRPMRVLRFPGAEWVEWEFAFDSTAIYDFSRKSYARDQYDWNKLVGLKWDFLRPRNNTLLVGWRWNLETRQLELAPYLHADGDREMHKPMYFVVPGERFGVRIDWSAKTSATFTFTKAGEKPVVREYTFSVPDGDPWQILHWFGGTQAAPHDIALRVYATRTSAD